ncbi:MAG: maleylacetoacetate isomerase [Bdellovibrionaceae bacterium]|nr:maleylacetoacetate isomerase [Pseudobdellovibrionaceae bacterium]
MSELILYSYYRSSASHRVRIALKLKGLDYEYRAVHLLNNGGEQNTSPYNELNPSRQVPTLIHKGRALGQSVAIIEYLDSLRPEPPLFPQDAYERARVLQACEIVNSGIQPLGNLSVLQQLQSRAGFDQDKKTEWVQHWVNNGLQALTEMVQTTAGRYCFGNLVTAADCFLVPQIFNAIRFQVDLERFPLLMRIHQTCMELPEFIASAPDVQPDTPRP